MVDLLAITAPRIFDSETWHDTAALVVPDGIVEAIAARGSIPEDARRIDLAGDLVPGFVDLQVNGGGGVLFNNQPDVAAIEAICRAHAQFGTTALLPTLITDTAAVNEAAIAAGIDAVRAQVPGFLSLHLESPHLAIARKGTHDLALIRPMDQSDLDRVLAPKRELPMLLVTVAAETAGPDQIKIMADAGIVVSIGHSDADAITTERAFEAGARQATHLYNAMSQLQNREPGVVGAALGARDVFAGLIADGIHVHPSVIRVAFAAKLGPGRIFLVSDSMSQTGSDLTSFELNGRTVYRANGDLRLANGTLAGADLDMIDAIHFMHEKVDVPWEEALRMASLYSSRAVGIDSNYGHLRPGAIASFVELDGAQMVSSTWVMGSCRYQAEGRVSVAHDTTSMRSFPA
ncbi:MAG: N-acetylglucosamine-6-phosphate deacetylase [Candidatus Devosia phytovorans]|uniref:N-acetylglucosamine-6-phosphate deacetylase n=1 Tax=Candidatus Devosia phytovorans TaxID=3121372 RepID=A0AAJ6AZZ7_9HYPH|nr:N-acetylglucosamine-6-phosphate deacetylase [Devosia sp.]WEK02993.1 MAG: N-acetylglucosamine-6-phosphate deacetylase [Devosia sp.]